MELMNSTQRFHAALDGHVPDRIPLFYQHLGAAKWLLQSTGLRMRDGFFDPEVFSKLAMAAYERFGFDNVMAGWGDILIEAQAHGMKWKFPERDFYPRVDQYVPMSDLEEVQPIDPCKDPIWSVPIKAAKIMMDHYGNKVPVVGCINSPTVIASELVGMENLLIGYLTDPEAVDHLLITLTESSKAYGERIIELGVEDVFIENGTAGSEMVSQEMYERFDRKYLEMEMGSYHQHGLRTILHNCAASPFWRSQLEAKPTALHLNLDALNVPEVFKSLKGKTAVMAGIDHIDLLFSRTPAEIEENVRGAMAAWGNDPGLILAPGCELPYKTPLENIKALRDCVIRYGTYQTG